MQGETITKARILSRRKRKKKLLQHEYIAYDNLNNKKKPHLRTCLRTLGSVPRRDVTAVWLWQGDQGTGSPVLSSRDVISVPGLIKLTIPNARVNKFCQKENSEMNLCVCDDWWIWAVAMIWNFLLCVLVCYLSSPPDRMLHDSRGLPWWFLLSSQHLEEWQVRSN